jgi:hypothetical protein
MSDAVNRDDDTDVLSIDVQRTSNGHWIDGIIFTIDLLWFSHHTVNRDVEAVVILRRKTEDTQTTVGVTFRIVRICGPQKSLNGELAALDPDFGRLIHAVKDDGSTIRGGDNDARVIRSGTWSCLWLKCAVKEFIEVFEILHGEQDLAHIQLMKIDELPNFSL